MKIKDICKIETQLLWMRFSLCFYESVKVHLYEQVEKYYASYYYKINPIS